MTGSVWRGLCGGECVTGLRRLSEAGQSVTDNGDRQRASSAGEHHKVLPGSSKWTLWWLCEGSEMRQDTPRELCLLILTLGNTRRHVQIGLFVDWIKFYLFMSWFTDLKLDANDLQFYFIFFILFFILYH